MKPGVFITVDVECSMGGAWRGAGLKPVPPSRGIMGEYRGRRLGVPLIVDILNSNNLAATFFVEAFNAERGYPGQTEPICKYLLDQGHDVQLHIHPNHKHYAFHLAGRQYMFCDNIADLPAKHQKSLLEEGCERLTRWLGRSPVAFRAGNMGASEQVLQRLTEVGIKIDSSYAFPLTGGQCRFSPDNPYNGTRWYGSVLELAMSGFYHRWLPGVQAAKLLDIVGVSFDECRDAVRGICRAGAHAVVILHSFSLFKVRNVQYDGGRADRIVISRFRRFCQWLADHAEQIPAYTVLELYRAVQENRSQANAVPPLTLPSLVQPFLRKVTQVVNRVYWI